MSPVTATPYVGMRIPDVVTEITTAQLFLFSAATWNPHRIHYDKPYAQSEQFEDVVVQSHLHACLLSQAALAPFGPGATIRSISWQNRAPAYPGDTLVVSGEVTEVGEADGRVLATIALLEHRSGNIVCVRAAATVAVPSMSTAGEGA